MIEAVLLGGSNSVTSHGLQDGLSHNLRLTNLALGASSVIQNLYEVIRNGEVISQADVVISESNVNDSYNVANLNVDAEFILQQIEAFYSELSSINPNCIVLLLPLQRANPKVESSTLVDRVNRMHRQCATRYGFHTVDVVHAWSIYDDKSVNMLMADQRHPNHAYMYNIGRSIGEFVVDKINVLRSRKDRYRASRSSRYRAMVFSPGCEQGAELKFNSKFNEFVVSVDIDNGLNIDKQFVGMRLVGIGTWSDDDSILKICNGGSIFYKAFSKLNSFNEFCSKIVVTEDFVLCSELSVVDLSERSVNVPRMLEPKESVKISGLLFESMDKKQTLNTSFPKSDDISYLLPPIEPYIKSLEFYLERREI
jgi:hypothetical protein